LYEARITCGIVCKECELYVNKFIFVTIYCEILLYLADIY